MSALASTPIEAKSRANPRKMKNGFLADDANRGCFFVTCSISKIVAHGRISPKMRVENTGLGLPFKLV